MAFNAAGYNPYNQFQPSYGTYNLYNPTYSSFGQQSGGYAPQYPGYTGYRYTATRPYIAEQPRFLYVSQPTQAQSTNNSWNWLKFARTAGAVASGVLLAFLLAKNVAKNEIKNELPEAVKKMAKENLPELFGPDGDEVNITETAKEGLGMFNQAKAIFQAIEEAGGVDQIKKTLQQVNEASQAVEELGGIANLKEVGQQAIEAKQAFDELGGVAELKAIGQQAKDASRAFEELGGVTRLQEVGQQVLNAWDKVKDNWLFKKFTGS